MEQVDDLLPYGGSRLATLEHGVGGAALQVVGEEHFFGAPESRMNGGELLEDIGTVTLVLDHALNAFDLTAGTSEALENLVLGGLGDAHSVWWVGSVVGHGTRLEVHRAIQGSGVLCYTAV
jgi:hypothetical protein